MLYHIIRMQRGARVGNVLEKPWKKLKCGLFVWALEQRDERPRSWFEPKAEGDRRAESLAFDARRVPEAFGMGARPHRAGACGSRAR